MRKLIIGFALVLLIVVFGHHNLFAEGGPGDPGDPLGQTVDQGQPPSNPAPSDAYLGLPGITSQISVVINDPDSNGIGPDGTFSGGDGNDGHGATGDSLDDGEGGSGPDGGGGDGGDPGGDGGGGGGEDGGGDE